MLNFFERIRHSLHYNTLVSGPLLGLMLSLIWDVYLVKKIMHYIALYRRCVEKGKSDPFDNYAVVALHLKSEIIKYVFLLVSNITEFVSLVIYSLDSVIIGEPKSFEKVLFPNKITSPNCSIKELIHFHSTGIELMVGNPINSILLSIGEAGLILSITLITCLLKYLHVTYHDINNSPYRFIRLFLVVTFVIGVVLVIMGSVPQLIILYKLLRPVIPLIYLCICMKYIWIFNQTLKWRTVELRIRDGRDWIIRKSVISRYQFLLIMCIVAFSLGFLIISEFLEDYFFLIAVGSYYGPCVFNYLYGTPYYQPLVYTQQQLQLFTLSGNIVGYFNNRFTTLAAFLIGIEYILATVIFFGRILREKLRYRFGKVRTRYTPSLKHHLLSHQVN